MMKLLVLDVNPYLSILEDIFNRYVRIENEELLRFIPGSRYPVVDIAGMDITMANVVRNTPYYPYKSAQLLCRLLLLEIYMASENYIHYLSNYALPKESKHCSVNLFPDHNKDETDIVLEYIPNITIPDLHSIIEVTNTFINQNHAILEPLKNCVLEFDVEGEYLIIKNKGEVTSYRYLEVINGIKK